MSGKVLGAQNVGYDGVEKRIDVIATAIRFNATVFDLTELELAYAPPYSSAKDPVNMAGFVGLIAFSGIFMFVFSWFREQACIVVCPYGRLQGVFLDDNSINVMYDYVRGEPRGPIKKNPTENLGKGDCVDCSLCVQVCPTGIDIRNGTQMECVNCTACIDACDDVMLKVMSYFEQVKPLEALMAEFEIPE